MFSLMRLFLQRQHTEVESDGASKHNGRSRGHGGHICDLVADGMRWPDNSLTPNGKGAAACQSQTSAASQTDAASGGDLMEKGGDLSITDQRCLADRRCQWRRPNGKGRRPVNRIPALPRRPALPVAAT
jgi:hypothetical protein